MLFSDRLYLASIATYGGKETVEMPDGRILRAKLTDFVGMGLEEVTVRRALEWFAAAMPYSQGTTGDLRLLCRLAAKQLAALGK